MRQDDGVVDLETLYDGLNRVLEEDGGTVEADYTTTPEPYGNALSQHRSGDSSFYLWDGIRNVRQLTDGAEVVTDSYGFDGWGRSTGSSGSTANTQQWQGQSIAYRKDADAGPESQYAMHHRNYNPRSGVFTAADPAKDDLNLYRYVHNNPVNRDDPSGLAEIKAGKLTRPIVKQPPAQTCTDAQSLLPLGSLGWGNDHQLKRSSEQQPTTTEGRLLGSLKALSEAADPAVGVFFAENVDEIVINRNTVKPLRWTIDWLWFGDHFQPSVRLEGKTLHVEVYQGHHDTEIELLRVIHSSLSNETELLGPFADYLRNSIADPNISASQASTNIQRWQRLVNAQLEAVKNLAATAASAQWSMVASAAPSGEILISVSEFNEARKQGDRQGMALAVLGGAGGFGRIKNSMEEAADLARAERRLQECPGQKEMPNAAANANNVPPSGVSIRKPSPKGYDRKPQLPSESDGKWINADGTPGRPGESFFVPKDPAIQAKLPSGQVPFVKGQPDFPAVGGVEVRIRMTGVRTDRTDFVRAREAFGHLLKQDPTVAKNLGLSEETVSSFFHKNGNVNVSAIETWEAQRGVVWDHRPDLQSMRLVDATIHGDHILPGIKHTGGASYARYVTEELIKRGLMTDKRQGLTPELIEKARELGIIPAVE